MVSYRQNVIQEYISSSYLFNLYTEHIIRENELDSEEEGEKISGINISNLRNTDDTILLEEHSNDLK